MTSSFNTAYDIPLTQTDLAMIGEICAIQGQIEYLMQQTVQHLLGTKHTTTLVILTASNNLPAASNIWIHTIRDKCTEWKLSKLQKRHSRD